MPTPTTPHKSRNSSGSKAAADAVGKAIGSIRPIVSMWRDGLTVIALGSSAANRTPDYLTFDQATADAALDIHEAPTQTVPTVEAVTGKSTVLILGGDTIIGGAQNRIINITILLKAASSMAGGTAVADSPRLARSITRCAGWWPSRSLIAPPRQARPAR